MKLARSLAALALIVAGFAAVQSAPVHAASFSPDSGAGVIFIPSGTIPLGGRVYVHPGDPARSYLVAVPRDPHECAPNAQNVCYLVMRIPAQPTLAQIQAVSLNGTNWVLIQPSVEICSNYLGLTCLLWWTWMQGNYFYNAPLNLTKVATNYGPSPNCNYNNGGRGFSVAPSCWSWQPSSSETDFEEVVQVCGASNGSPFCASHASRIWGYVGGYATQVIY